MIELKARVAKAIYDARKGHDEWSIDDFALARAALDAIGIDRILEVLRPFVEGADAYETAGFHGLAHKRLSKLYKELGGI